MDDWNSTESIDFLPCWSDTITQVTKRSVSSHADVVETALRRAIIAAEFEPGQRLSAEALAVRFNVSPTPVREALARLAGDNLVVAKPQRGVRVAELSLTAMEEIYEIRGLLEPLAIERSVQRFDDQARAHLVSRYEVMVEHAAGGIQNLDTEQ